MTEHTVYMCFSTDIIHGGYIDYLLHNENVESCRPKM